MLTTAIIYFASLPPEANQYPGKPFMYKLGFAAFVYPEGIGKLQPLWFRNNLIVADSPGATGVKVFTFPDADWQCTFNGVANQGNLMDTPDGPFNPCENVLGGNGVGNSSPMLGTILGAAAAIRTAYMDGGQNIQLEPIINSTDNFDGAQKASVLSPLLLALQFASEIAQVSIMENGKYEVVEYGPATGSGHIQLTDQVFTRGMVTQVGVIPPKYFWRPYGLRRIGCVAFGTNDAYCPPIWINDASQMIRPPLPGLEQLYYRTENGVSFEFEMNQANFAASAMFTGLGQLGWVSGQFSGVRYPPTP
jgi:hypothetical protein